METKGVSRIDALELLANAGKGAPLPTERSGHQGEPSAGSHVGAPRGSGQQPAGKEAAELIIGSKRRAVGSDLHDSYAKIRFDENTNTVLIQIINAANGEVIREIPPGAWSKLKGSVVFPKGLLVEKEQ